LSTRGDIAIARHFEPTEDGHFLHRDGGKEYKLTRAQAGALARRLERAQTSHLFFSLFFMFHILDFFFDLGGQGFWSITWLSIRGLAAFLALAAAILAAVEAAKATTLLKDCASSEIGKPKGPTKPWRQRFVSWRIFAGIRRMGNRNLILHCLTYSLWFVVSGLILLTSPSWFAEASAWLAEAGGGGFEQGALYFGVAVFLVLVLVLVILSPLAVAICLKTLHDRFGGPETGETKI